MTLNPGASDPWTPDQSAFGARLLEMTARLAGASTGAELQGGAVLSCLGLESQRRARELAEQLEGTPPRTAEVADRGWI